MPGIQVVTDSASDLPEALVAEHHIEIVPLTIRFDDEEFVDLQELTPTAFWKRCAETASFPETAAPSPGAFQAAFERAETSGKDGVVCINISSGLSGTLQSATTGAAALPGDPRIRLVDSTFGSMAQGLVVLAAAEAASADASLDEVESAARSAIAGIKGFFTLDTLENLRRGGRIGNARALLGALLSIKPLMESRGGVAELVSRQRTRRRALSSLIDAQRSNGGTSVLAVSHGDAVDIDGHGRAGGFDVDQVPGAARQTRSGKGNAVGLHMPGCRHDVRAGDRCAGSPPGVHERWAGIDHHPRCRRIESDPRFHRARVGSLGKRCSRCYQDRAAPRPSGGSRGIVVECPWRCVQGRWQRLGVGAVARQVIDNSRRG